MAIYTYDNNGNVLTKSLADGTLASSTYNSFNQLTDFNYTLGGTSFAEFAYNYDNVDRRNYEKRDSGKGDVYAYDGDDQVTSVEYDATNPSGATPTGPDRTVNYSYDPVGNAAE